MISAHGLTFNTEEEAILFGRIERQIENYIACEALSFTVNILGLTYDHQKELVRRYSTAERTVQKSLLGDNLRFRTKS